MQPASGLRPARPCTSHSRVSIISLPQRCLRAPSTAVQAHGRHLISTPSPRGTQHQECVQPSQAPCGVMQEQQQQQQQVEAEASTTTSPSPARHHGVVQGLPVASLTAAAYSMLTPGIVHASEGTLTGQSVELFKQFLGQVEALGPWGGALFVSVVMLFEMVPLFPTQPLSLASGLLFGAQKGALLMLMGVTLAAVNAFLIARGVGRPLAQKVIDAEMSHAGGGSKGGTIAKTMADVQAAIEGGGLWKQMTAITLLRLTPVVPFSASNYLLGLTPVQLPAFLGGTLLGMSVWSALYASLGGASRALLDRGADMETLLADLGDKASAVSSNAVYISGGLAVSLTLAWLVRTYVSWPSNEDGALSTMATLDEDEPAAAEMQPQHNGNGNGNGNGTPSSNGSGASKSEAVSTLAGRASPQHSLHD